MKNSQNTIQKSKQNDNYNNESSIKRIKTKSTNDNELKEKFDESRRKINKSSKKKRKKKKKLLKQLESQASEICKINLFHIDKNKPTNPYRIFLLYKLRKKYNAKLQTYDTKKVNELIFNIPSHFTAIFKEYLLKEEEAEFLKRIYHKNEIDKKLKSVFNFYEKYSKIFPNYIVIPEGQYLYRNILKKQKMIDKLQKIKEEEMKNKEMLLEGSFNTIFSNGAIDSIYNNNIDSFNTLTNIICLENNDKNEDEISQLETIINNIEKYENTSSETQYKKQIIYKKEFRDLNSLSKSIILKNGKEVENEKFEKNENGNKIKKTKNNKNINRIKKIIPPKNKKLIKISENIQINTESESENIEEKSQNEKFNITKNYNEKPIENEEINKSNEHIKKNKISAVEKNKIKNDEDDIIIKNKNKKYIVLRGSKHYFIKNTVKNEKSIENKNTTYINDEKISNKSKIEFHNENQLIPSNIRDYKNNNSFSQNKNISKDYLGRNNQNLILYKKKLCNNTRGLSISKKNNDLENDKVLHKVSTNYTINGSKIVKIRKYFINEQKNFSVKNVENNDLNQDNNYYWNDKSSFLNYNDRQNINMNYYKTITYSKSNFDLNEQNRNNHSINGINGNIYYKKYRADNLRNSHGDKSCPKKFNKFMADIHNEIKRKKYVNNIQNSIEEKDKRQNNIDEHNINNHRYYQNNSKKFRLKAPKNYYKIDLE